MSIIVFIEDTKRSDITYEELILNWNLSNGYFSSYSSDITYEELILSSICREKAFPKSDITYEELIHASSASDG